MLVIRQGQLKAFEGEADTRFEQRMVARLWEHFTAQCQFIGETRVREVVRFGVTAASRRGYLSRRTQSTYLFLMFLLGSGFEDDPQWPFIGAVPSAVPSGEPERRIAALFDDALAFCGRIAGNENERLVRALVRMRDFDVAAFAAPEPASQPQAIAQALAQLYPEKAALLGEHRLHALALSGGALATSLELATPSGAMLCAGLAFMLGSGFHRDPLFPWIEEALKRPAPDRFARLHEGAMAFVHVALG